jgi:hypothetical protein
MYSFSMVRLFSTRALGGLEICLGSVIACARGNFWAGACVLIAVLITTTIANQREVRMDRINARRRV